MTSEQEVSAPYTEEGVSSPFVGNPGKTVQSIIRTEATLLALGVAQRVARVRPEKRSTVKRLDRGAERVEHLIESVERGLDVLVGWWLGM